MHSTIKFLHHFSAQKFQDWSCKKTFDHYNAIPSLNDLIAESSFISDLIFDTCEGLLALIFLAIARKPSSLIKLSLVSGAQRQKLRKAI